MKPEEYLAYVREYNRRESQRELRRRIAYALDAGLPETKVAEAAGITRPTLRAWTHRRWIIDWRGEQVESTGRTLSAYDTAVTLTDWPVIDAGFDGPHADDLEPGESTMLTINTREGSLHYRVTRVE